MALVSRLTRGDVPADVARIFARMHVPERLGMGVERVPARLTRRLESRPFSAAGQPFTASLRTRLCLGL